MIRQFKVVGGALACVLLVGCGREDDGNVEAAAKEALASRTNFIVIFTDDHGYADLGIQGVVDDVRTPNIDQLAKEGVLFTNGYVTAPVCSPSRAGLLMGRYQQRYGIETNADFPIELSDPPVPERLRRSGYRTGMSGKLHLRVRSEDQVSPASWGFDEFSMKVSNFAKVPNRRLATHDLNGHPFSDGPQWIEPSDYRTDVDTEAALQFIDRNHERPFFLYLAYFAPHVPAEAPDRYLERFASAEPEGRRYALAMISAVDDGVGRILERLRKHDIHDRTLVFFISDNGAPLEPNAGNVDLPLAKLKRWNGSLNSPLLGGKGTLLEGGIRVPYIAHWPAVLPSGTVYREPVSTLDVAATALAAATESSDATLDGTDLVPYLTGKSEVPPHEALFWAIGGQAAVRKGKWKWLTTQTSGAFLFDLDRADPEAYNLVDSHPEVAARLDSELQAWLGALQRRPPPSRKRLRFEKRLYRSYLADVGG